MTLKRRQFTREFKLQVLREADSGNSISQLALEHQGPPHAGPSLAATISSTV